jgi:hypothetical protein
MLLLFFFAKVKNRRVEQVLSRGLVAEEGERLWREGIGA